MPSRSQRHLRAIRGLDSSGSAGAGAIDISTTAGSKTNPVALAGTATSGEGLNIGHLVQWSSNVDGVLGTGAALSATLTVSAHVITATVGGLTDTLAITVTA